MYNVYIYSQLTVSDTALLVTDLISAKSLLPTHVYIAVSLSVRSDITKSLQLTLLLTVKLLDILMGARSMGASSFDHVMVGVGTPLEQHEKMAVVPTSSVVDCGWWVMSGKTIGTQKHFLVKKLQCVGLNVTY